MERHFMALKLFSDVLYTGLPRLTQLDLNTHRIVNTETASQATNESTIFRDILVDSAYHDKTRA